MNRLTEKYKIPRIVCDFGKCKGSAFNFYVEGKNLNWHDEDLTKPRAGIHSFRGKKVFGEAIDRLALYEDTGLEPDEIPHWIPVSERMPKHGNVYLVCTAGQTVTTAYLDGAGDWVGESNQKMTAVTHWQPLPQPPKEEK